MSLQERAVELLTQGVAESVLINQGFGSVIDAAKKLIAAQQPVAQVGVIDQAAFEPARLETEVNCGNVSAVCERECNTATAVAELAPHPMIAYVNALFKPDDRVCIVLIEPGVKTIQDFRSTRQITEPAYIERLTAQNQQRNIYVGMNPILAGHNNRTKDDVARIAAVYLDLDTDGGSKLEAINVSPDVPKPSFVLRSSDGKFQVIWRITDISKPDQEALLVGLIQKFGGDPACKDCTRVLRLPGFANVKYPSRPVVEVVQMHDGVYHREDFKIYCMPVAEKKLPVTASSDGPRVARGSHDTELIRIAGKLRAAGLEYDEIVPILERNVEDRFDEVGSDWREMCAAKAKSACRYPKGDGSIPLSTAMQDRMQAAEERKQQPTAAAVVQPVEIPEFTKVPYPVFPRWIMEQPGESGIAPSIYTGLVKPWCDVNSRYPEFMFVPALALLLNYLNKKVRIEYNDTPFSIFMMLIGKAGRVIKSSSVESAIRYLADAGVCDYASSVSTADLKTLVWTAGSTEGLGMGMRDKSCVNSVLFYDELKTAASKAKIDAASLGSVLLTMYESGLFQNQIKSGKSSFSFPPKSYVTSFIACNTDEDFAENWASLATGKKGMDERFFFLLQPEHLDPLKPKHDVDCSLAAVGTKKLIDKAIVQGAFNFADTRKWDAKIEEFGNRASLRAAKWALAFAVDMGLDVIDEDCLERGYALTQYELDVKHYLGARDAETREASVQIKVRELLSRQPNGRMTLSKLCAAIKPERYGTSLWMKIYSGLINAKIIREEGAGTKADPVVVQLLKTFSEEASNA